MNATLAISLVAALGVGFVYLYNSLIFRKNGIEQSFGAIHSYMKKRVDLIPNLVAVVGEFTDHERDLLEKITALRTGALNLQASEAEQIVNSDQLSGFVKQLMVSVENYPDLKSNKNFQDLQGTLVDIETQLSAARRSYNAAVVHYNNGVEMIPYNIVAALMGLKKQKVFEVDTEDQDTVSVSSHFDRRKTGS